MKNITICYWEFASRFDNYAASSVAFILNGWCHKDDKEKGLPPVITPGYTMSGVNPAKITTEDCWKWAEEHQESE